MSWLPKRLVVVPVDFSENSFAAVDTALDLVSDPSHVRIVYVLPAIEPAEPDVVWTTIDDDVRRSHAEQALAERLSDARYRGVQICIRFGDAGREVAALAQEQHAELIVLSSHGRTGLSRLLIGSVAEKIVRLAHCPVLVLRK